MHRVTVVDEIASRPLQQVVVLIGDDGTIVNRLVRQTDNGSGMNMLRLENKYYQAKVDILLFQNVLQFTIWHRKNHEGFKLGALFICNTREKELELMSEWLDDYPNVNQERAHAVVITDNETDLDRVLSWTMDNEFEPVTLNPDQSSIEEATTYGEKISIQRLVEILHGVEWPIKTLMMDRRTGNDSVDRLLHEAMKQSANEPSDSEDDWEPDEEDKEEIWKLVTSSEEVQRLVKNAQKPPKEEEEEATAEVSVEVNVEFKKKERVEDVGQAVKADEIALEKNKKKKNKKKKANKVPSPPAPPATASEPKKTDKITSSEADEIYNKFLSDLDATTTSSLLSNVSLAEKRAELQKLSFKERADAAGALVMSLYGYHGDGKLAASKTETKE